MRTRLAYLAALLAAAACKEGRRAPTEPPAAPSFGTLIVDFIIGGGDAGAELRYPTVLVAGPQVYFVYVEPAGQVARFAGCPGSCDRQGNWRVGTIRTESSGANFSAAVLTRSGLQVVYNSYSAGGLRYLTCPGLCDDSTHWQMLDVDTAGATGLYAALAANQAGGLRALYVRVDNNKGWLQYAECEAGCLSAANWRLATIDSQGGAGDPAVGIDGGGRIHVVYRAPNPSGSSYGIRYATCAAACTDPTNWGIIPLDETPGFTYDAPLSLGIGADNHLHLIYWTLGDLRYATCPANCSSLASWEIAVVATNAGYPRGSALAIGPSGRVHLAYSDGEVRYASCDSGCAHLSGSQWITVAPRGFGGSGYDFVALAIDSLDQPHLALSTGGGIKYAWRNQ
jgi:hypothetical protein